VEDKEKEAAVALAVAAATAELKLAQLRIEMDELWKWKKENEAVLLWARNFMETYRKTFGTVLASGAITIIALLIQLYYTLGKSK
jgi:hypothetical protein